MATNKFIIYQQHHQRENEKYKRKLRRLKQNIKNIVYVSQDFIVLIVFW